MGTPTSAQGLASCSDQSTCSPQRDMHHYWQSQPASMPPPTTTTAQSLLSSIIEFSHTFEVMFCHTCCNARAGARGVRVMPRSLVLLEGSCTFTQGHWPSLPYAPGREPSKLQSNVLVLGSCKGTAVGRCGRHRWCTVCRLGRHEHGSPAGGRLHGGWLRLHRRQG